MGIILTFSYVGKDVTCIPKNTCEPTVIWVTVLSRWASNTFPCQGLLYLRPKAEVSNSGGSKKRTTKLGHWLMIDFGEWSKETWENSQLEPGKSIFLLSTSILGFQVDFPGCDSLFWFWIFEGISCRTSRILPFGGQVRSWNCLPNVPGDFDNYHVATCCPA